MAIIANKYWQILTQRERSELAAASANEGEADADKQGGGRKAGKES